VERKRKNAESEIAGKEFQKKPEEEREMDPQPGEQMQGKKN